MTTKQEIEFLKKQLLEVEAKMDKVDSSRLNACIPLTNFERQRGVLRRKIWAAEDRLKLEAK